MTAFVKKLTSVIRFSWKVIPVILGLVGLAFVIAWISGVFVEKIPPGEARQSARMLDNQSTDKVDTRFQPCQH